MFIALFKLWLREAYPRMRERASDKNFAILFEKYHFFTPSGTLHTVHCTVNKVFSAYSQKATYMYILYKLRQETFLFSLRTNVTLKISTVNSMLLLQICS
jgi:hypothetical protein